MQLLILLDDQTDIRENNQRTVLVWIVECSANEQNLRHQRFASGCGSGIGHVLSVQNAILEQTATLPLI